MWVCICPYDKFTEEERGGGWRHSSTTSSSNSVVNRKHKLRGQSEGASEGNVYEKKELRLSKKSVWVRVSRVNYSEDGASWQGLCEWLWEILGPDSQCTQNTHKEWEESRHSRTAATHQVRPPKEINKNDENSRLAQVSVSLISGPRTETCGEYFSERLPESLKKLKRKCKC